MSATLLGTCNDACALACTLASQARSGEGGMGIVLLVALAIFLIGDAAIACVAIYGAGCRPRSAAGTVALGPERVPLVVREKGP